MVKTQKDLRNEKMQDIHEMEKNCEGSLSCWVPLGKAM
jgi:hypothetical protein